MNRIILIGNGFDLAHGLKTSYKNFIDDNWEGFMNHCIYQDVVNISGIYHYDCIELIIPEEGLTLSSFLPDGDNRFQTPNKKPIIYKELMKGFEEYNNNRTIYNKIKFSISNNFLLHLLEKCNKEMPWVDIENEYYKFLSYQFDKRKYNGYYYENIKTLNWDFEHVKLLLNKYLFNLKEETTIQKSEHIWKLIYSPLLLKDFTEIGQESVANDEYWKIKSALNGTRSEFQNPMSDKTRSLLDVYKKYDDEVLRNIILYDLQNEDRVKQYFELELKSILFLNFNYTDSENNYSYNDDFYNEIIHIHGELSNTNNPIIFGYGDELEENYSKLENLQDNAYLENIKSIQYQETDNYKKMLNFINSDKYQVIILGHSCGNSDRTLLNTLFEHENCVSIKPYYFQYKDEKTGELKDNYSDIVRNISRNFTDKKSMRDKVVNKTYTDWFSRSAED